MGKRTTAMIVICFGLAAQRAFCELTPSQCAVLYNSERDGSVDVAQYYAISRGISAERLLGLPLGRSATLDRDVYDTVVRPNVRAFLARHAWGKDVRCLITTYGVPLRVRPMQVNPAAERRARVLDSRIDQAASGIEDLIDDMSPASSPASKPARGKITRGLLSDVFDRYENALRGLGTRARGLSGDAARRSSELILRFIYRGEGYRGLLVRAQRNQSGLAPSSIPRLADAGKIVEKRLEEIERLSADGTTAREFDAAIPIMRDTIGLVGLSKALFDRIGALRGERSDAAFDSELTMVLADAYRLHHWRPNDLFAYGDGGSKPDTKTLMVGRLDGPTSEIVRRMVDDAIATERNGLRGTFYIDARGLSRGTGYATVDRDMEDLALLVRTRTELPVVVDRRADVFAPGSCPGAALYCGWYSLANYVDAFDFVPGAVAVHLASFELIALRDPSKPYWCKELLKNGAAATFGATSEPYLESFPLPTRFFGTLLTGQYTLVETFYRSNPYNSWQLSVVGDPLYNPFKNNPQLPADWDKQP